MSKELSDKELFYESIVQLTESITILSGRVAVLEQIILDKKVCSAKEMQEVTHQVSEIMVRQLHEKYDMIMKEISGKKQAN